MPKRDTPAVVDLADYMAKKADEGKIIVKVADGDDFVIPAPSTWPDEVMEAAGRNPIDQAKAILGGEEYARFKECGGNAMVINALIEDYSGVTAPE